MTSKHTPGPWTVTDNSWEISSVYAPDGSVVAEVNIDASVDEDSQDHFEAVKEANARLIAAAPDLLAMLKVAQLWLDVDGRFDMQGINAAIAKAEGSQP